jgi:thiopurine S-methyltransferase
LCGKSLDLLWLRTQGHAVIGVELSRIAVEAFFMENGILARRRSLADFEVYEADGLTLYCGDFFKLTPALLGNVSAVYDRASLISWTIELRAPYAAHMAALAGPATQTLLITVEYPPLQMSGPPFPVFGADLESLYAEQHEMRLLGAQEILELEPRLKARGLTEMREVCYRLTRI